MDCLFIVLLSHRRIGVNQELTIAELQALFIDNPQFIIGSRMVLRGCELEIV